MEDTTFTGAGAAAEVITASAARTVFALAGAQHSKLLAELEQAGVRIVGNRSEAAVVGAADGYARVAGRVGFGLIIAGQGVVNSLAGFATALEARSPVVVVIARPPLGQEDPFSPPYHTSGAFLAPVIKWHVSVEDAQRLGDCLDMAVAVASAPPAGPVAVTVPADFLAASVTRRPAGAAHWRAAPRRADPCPVAEPAVAEPAVAEPAVAEAAVAEAAAALAAARRPVVVAGTGMRRAGGAAALAQVRDTLRIPVLLEAEAKGLLGEDLDLVYPWPLAQTAVGSADLVVLAGCALGDRLGGGRPPRFSASARFVQFDEDAAEFCRGAPGRLAIKGSPAAVLAALVSAARSDGGYDGGGGAWLAEALQERTAAIAAVPDSSASGLHPYAIARRLTSLLDGPAIVVGDGADILAWMHGQFRLREGSVWMDHHPLGSMGVGLPLALGACAAEQEMSGPGRSRPVVLVTGDGALGYNVAELETAARCGLPVRVVVSNDGAWGTERHGQLQRLGHAVNTDLLVAGYEQVAEGLGADGFVARTEEELDAALAALPDHPGPVLVNVLVDRDSGRLRKQQPLLEMIYFNEFALDEATKARDRYGASR
jgi:acetolactate synthase-1/2/3 large subunit